MMEDFSVPINIPDINTILTFPLEGKGVSEYSNTPLPLAQTDTPGLWYWLDGVAGVMYCDVVRDDVMWCVCSCHDVIYYDTMWCNMVYCMLWYGIVWCGVVWLDGLCYGFMWCVMVLLWCGTLWWVKNHGHSLLTAVWLYWVSDCVVLEHFQLLWQMALEWFPWHCWPHFL